MKTEPIPVDKRLPMPNQAVLVLRAGSSCIASLDQNKVWRDAVRGETLHDVLAWYEPAGGL